MLHGAGIFNYMTDWVIFSTTVGEYSNTMEHIWLLIFFLPAFYPMFRHTQRMVCHVFVHFPFSLETDAPDALWDLAL